MTNDELTSFWNDNYPNDKRCKVTLSTEGTDAIKELTSALRMYEDQGNYPWTVYMKSADGSVWVEIPISRILAIEPVEVAA